MWYFGTLTPPAWLEYLLPLSFIFRSTIFPFSPISSSNSLCILKQFLQLHSLSNLSKTSSTVLHQLTKLLKQFYLQIFHISLRYYGLIPYQPPFLDTNHIDFEEIMSLKTKLSLVFSSYCCVFDQSTCHIPKVQFALVLVIPELFPSSNHFE